MSLSVIISQANLRLFIKAKRLQEEENIFFEWGIGPARKIINRLLTGVNLVNSRLGSDLPEAVSYTHLDVYKRQIYRTSTSHTRKRKRVLRVIQEQNTKEVCPTNTVVVVVIPIFIRGESMPQTANIKLQIFVPHYLKTC